MFHRTLIDKHSELHHIKNKNDEKNIKKTKKNKNEPPSTGRKPSIRQIKGKEAAEGKQNTSVSIDKSISRSKSKSLNKFTTQYPSKHIKDKTPTKKHTRTPIKLSKGESSASNKKSSQAKSKQRSPSTSRKTTITMTQREQMQIYPLENPKKQLFQSEKKTKSPCILMPKRKKKEKKNETNSKSNTIKIVDSSYEEKCLSDRLERNYTQPIEEGSNEEDTLHTQYRVNIKRRQIPHIKTQFSGRKTSCIDDSLLKRLQYHRSNKNFDFIDSCFVKSISQETKNQENHNLIHKKSKQIEKNTDIVVFKRQQEEKWVSMLQQIKKLKDQTQISEKIDFLIQEITQNYNHLQLTARSAPKYQEQIDSSKNNVEQADRTYPLSIHEESLQSQHHLSSLVEHDVPETVNQQQPRSHMISLNDFFQSSDKPNHLKKDLFRCQEKLFFQDQLCKHADIQQSSIEQKSLNPQANEEKQDEKDMTTTVIIDNGSASDIWTGIMHKIIDQFCLQLMNNKKILHNFLLSFDQRQMYPTPNAQQLTLLLQKSTNEHVFNLTQQLLNYFFQYYRDYTLKQLSFYYQCKPIEVLRYVRSPHLSQSQSEEDLDYEIENERQLEIPFFSLAKIQEFETHCLGNQQYAPEYFTFNMCVYDAFNEIIDKIRPFGTKGKSIFTLQFSHGPTTEALIRQKVVEKMQRVLGHEFDNDFFGQELVHGEEGNFEILYFASMEVTECIYNEAIYEIFRILRRNLFQL